MLSDAVANWIQAAKVAVAPARLFIPFGLNDQDVLWVVVSLKADGCVCVGTAWNFENGHAIDPVDGIRSEEPRDLQFDQDDVEVTVSLDGFLQALARFRACVDRELAELSGRINRFNASSLSPDSDRAD
ncbi:MAG: hypothetical protein ACK58T_18660 [Phycisphaerae bacterium]